MLPARLAIELEMRWKASLTIVDEIAVGIFEPGFFLGVRKRRAVGIIRAARRVNLWNQTGCPYCLHFYSGLRLIEFHLYHSREDVAKSSQRCDTKRMEALIPRLTPAASWRKPGRWPGIWRSRQARPADTVGRSWTITSTARALSLRTGSRCLSNCARASRPGIYPARGDLACGMTRSAPAWALAGRRAACQPCRTRHGSSTRRRPITWPSATTTPRKGSWPPRFPHSRCIPGCWRRCCRVCCCCCGSPPPVGCGAWPARVIGEDSTRLDLDVTGWHNYRMDWGSESLPLLGGRQSLLRDARLAARPAGVGDLDR